MNWHQRAGDVWALVPAKAFKCAKSRLAPVMREAERARLSRAMLGDVLDLLRSNVRIAGILVVTADLEVAVVAACQGACTLADPYEAGTNAAVRVGLNHLAEIGAKRCLVVPGDVPFMCATELQKIIDALDGASVAVVPAKRDGGTNVLALSDPLMIVPAFGRDSFARHLQAAHSLSLSVEILHLAGAGHDIDLPVDIGDIPGSEAGARTRALLSSNAFLPVARTMFHEGAIP